MADNGAIPKLNAIQTPKARRPGKNISGFYQKNTRSQINFAANVDLITARVGTRARATALDLRLNESLIA